MNTTPKPADIDALVPASFATLLGWAVVGLERERTVFGLPRRAFWTGTAHHDLSVAIPGGRLETPLGVAAGPHTQLAHNLVVAWLAGARLLELKTVQVLDRLELPRPCIDAPAEGYNVEWSQELRLAESLEQYVSAWCLVHAIAPRVLGADAAARALAGTRLDASVGYDLVGIRSHAVTRFLDGLTDASESMVRLRARLPASLRSMWPEGVPRRVIDTVTLSSFHGCPPDEIERIVEHLFARHALNVVVKLNPTLLGFDEVDALLHGPLGWHHVALNRAAFDRDLQWDQALGLLDRLSGVAKRYGRALGVKLTNTLVVRNTRARLAGEAVYLSGAPLHPIAIRLADRLSRATSGAIPLSLSAGVNAENFATAVACGFTPVTMCTDLLQPTGYRRLPRYLKALTTEMQRCDVRAIDDYVRARASERGSMVVDTRAAAHANLAAYAASVGSDARFGADASVANSASASPAATRPPLALVDCESCNQCTLVCPNGAFFSVTTPRVTASDVSVPAAATAGTPAVAGPEPRSASGIRERQWVLLADFCNACGNCDTFCPQSGGPYRVKARFHTARAVWQRDASPHAVLVEDNGRRLLARLDGQEIALERATDGTIAIVPVGAPLVPAKPIAALPHATMVWLRLLTEQALAELNPLSAHAGLHRTQSATTFPEAPFGPAGA